MFCPRFKHFVRLNVDGTVSRCGHMINPPTFNSIEEMDSSAWQQQLIQITDSGQWPIECHRCQQTENINEKSIRLNSIEFDQIQTSDDYLIVGGTLDNVCNSACQTCSEHCSTKIGSLNNRRYLMINNTSAYNRLPHNRIVHLDLNGGEPSASPNYKQILLNLPKTVKSIRINTNCSLIIDEISMLIDNGVDVTITASFDGIEKVHDYLRWPIKWDKFYHNLMYYKSLPIKLNLWTTVSALNVGDLDNIFDFVKQHNFDHSWALLAQPHELNPVYQNHLTLTAKEKLAVSLNEVSRRIATSIALDKNNQLDIDKFIDKQDRLRFINIQKYIT